MAGAVNLWQAADGASAGTAGHRTHHRVLPPASFQQVLLRAFQGKTAAGSFQSAVHQAAARIPAAAAATPTAASSGAAE